MNSYIQTPASNDTVSEQKKPELMSTYTQRTLAIWPCAKRPFLPSSQYQGELVIGLIAPAPTRTIFLQACCQDLCLR